MAVEVAKSRVNIDDYFRTFVTTTGGNVTNVKCFSSFHITVTLTQGSQAIIKGSADLRGVSDSLDFWPGCTPPFPQYFFHFCGPEVGECFTQVSQVSIGNLNTILPGSPKY